MQQLTPRDQKDDSQIAQSKLNEYIEALENVKNEFVDILDRVRAMRNRIGIPVPPAEVKQAALNGQGNTTLVIHLESVIWNYREILGELGNEMALLEKFA